MIAICTKKKGELVYWVREEVEKEIFRMCDSWYTQAYHDEYAEQNQAVQRALRDNILREKVAPYVVGIYVQDCHLAYRQSSVHLLEMASANTPFDKIMYLSLVMKTLEQAWNSYARVNVSTDLTISTMVYVLYLSRYPNLVSDAVILQDYFATYDFTEQYIKMAKWITDFYCSQQYIVEFANSSHLYSPPAAPLQTVASSVPVDFSMLSSKSWKPAAPTNSPSGSPGPTRANAASPVPTRARSSSTPNAPLHNSS